MGNSLESNRWRWCSWRWAFPHHRLHDLQSELDWGDIQGYVVVVQAGRGNGGNRYLERMDHLLG